MDLTWWFDLTLRATILAAAAALGLLLTRRRSAATRHHLLSCALAMLLLLPLLAVLMPRQTLEWLPAQVTRTVEDASGFQLSIAPGDTSPAATSAAQASPDRRFPWQLALAVIWLGGLLLALLRLARQWTRLAGLGRRARRLPAQLDDLAESQLQHFDGGRVARIRLSSEVREPIAFAGPRATVLLPATAEAWPREEIELALLHELAHLERGDHWSNLIAQLACAVYWHHPLVWWLTSRLRHERELACDDRVLSTGQEQLDYASRLIAIARRLPRQAPAWSSAMALTRDGFRQRLDALLDDRRRRDGISLSNRWLIVLALTAITASVGGLAVRAEAAWRQALGCGKCPTATLLAGLEHEDSRYRLAALEGLEERAVKSTFYSILAQRSASEPEVRAAAVAAHAAIGCEPALASATLALTDPAPRVRQAGAMAFASFDPRWVHQPLDRLLAPRDFGTRAALRRHLGDYGSQVPLETLRRALHDPSLDVRAAARSSLALLQR